LDSLRGLALGMSLQNDLRVEVDLDTTNAKTAEDLVSAARRSQVQRPGVGAALQSEVDGNTARFRIELPGDQVIQAVKQEMEQGAGAQSPLAGLLGQSLPTFKSTTPAPAAPAEPMRGTIRIYGLDDGTREIHAHPRH
jgi:hypothetical protein